MIKKIVYLLIVLAFSSCDRWDYLHIINNSNQEVDFILGTGNNNGNIYPDTTLPFVKPIFVYSPIKSKSSTSYEIRNMTWEKIIDGLPSKTLSIYFFSSDTLNKYNWNEVIKHNKILQRKDYTKEVLKKDNWTITYP